jgi:O-antigen/teichoic acid export membrane protein
MQTLRKYLGGQLLEMRHNVAFVVLAQGVESISSALTYIVVGRLLGPNIMGLWSAIVATTAIVFGFVNLSSNVVVARETARNHHSGITYLHSALFLVLVWIIPTTVALSLGIGILLGFREIALWAILLVALSMGIGSLSSLWLAIFVAFERFEYHFYLNLGIRLTGIVVLTFFVYLIPNILTVLSMALITQAAFCTVAFLLVKRLIGPIYPRWNSSIVYALLRETLPITFASVMVHIGLRVDALLLERMRGAYEAGIYSAAYSIYMFGGVLLYSATIAFFPIFARSTNPMESEVSSFRSLFIRAGCALAVTGGLGIFLCWLASEYVIRLLFGPQFIESALPLRLLVIALPFVGVNRLGYQALNASNHQMITLLVTFIGTCFNIIANLLLIPIWGYIAASLTTIGTEALMAVIFAKFILKPHWSGFNSFLQKGYRP